MSHDHCHSHEGCHHCSCSKESEGQSPCGHGDNHEHEDFAHQLIEMADDAWMEVLHEKIKEKIIALNGAHLDKLASTIAETNHARWKGKMASHKSCSDFKAKIDQLLNGQ